MQDLQVLWGHGLEHHVFAANERPRSWAAIDFRVLACEPPDTSSPTLLDLSTAYIAGKPCKLVVSASIL